ncbi:MAG: YitT family protein, partial [Oscillospiraceae bacterium]
TLMTDYVLAWLPVYNASGGSRALAAVFGGLLMGVGLGLNYMRESTTGGVDILNKIVIRFRSGLRLGQVQLLLDGAVALLGFVVWHNMDAVLCALVSIFVQARVLDGIVYGGLECKLLMVFSDRSREITDRLVKAGFGVSLLKGEGAFSGAERQVIAAAVHKGDYIRARRMIKETDPQAFVVITGASEVFGEGFQKLE